MIKLNRPELPIQLTSLVNQLVDNNYLNVSFPVTGRTDGWALFYDGHPEHCQSDKTRPFVFMYSPQISEQQESISDVDVVRVVATIGVQAWCQNIGGNLQKVKELWYKIRYAFGMNSNIFSLPGTYTLDGTSVSNANLRMLGISSAQVIGDGFQINTKEIFRYSAQVEFLCRFNAFTISVQ